MELQGSVVVCGWSSLCLALHSLIELCMASIEVPGSHAKASLLWLRQDKARQSRQTDIEGIRTLAGRAQWISSPSP